MRKYMERSKNYIKTLSKFIGPGFMIAVGYLDPGNWATDMEGGSSYGYRLLFIILLSNVFAIYLQNLTIRLGTVAGLDLASASRRFLPRWLNLILYVLAEIAIIATDIAEVIGSAIALNLLFPRLPLPAGVAITAADVFIILLFYNEEANDDDGQDSASMRMVRFFEMFVMMLVGAVSICFIIELAYSDIVAVDVLKGYIPTKEIFTQPEILYVAIGIIGATVMPHNLYLHSFIVQARCREWKGTRPRVVERDGKWFIRSTSSSLKNSNLMLSEKIKEGEVVEQEEEVDHTTVTVKDEEMINFETLKHQLNKSLKQNLHYGFVDLIVALSVAFFVNCAILIVASANFYYGPDNSSQVVQDLFSAHALLLQYLGPPAAVVFALALLCAGQSSTLTATLAGQIVMSGFLGMTTRPWIRRIVTRLIAIIPAMVAACVAGRSGLSNMLVASQVALSIQLPFAVIPLVYFTAKKKCMSLQLVVKTTAISDLNDSTTEATTTDQKSMSLIDRTLARLRFSQNKSDWFQFPQFRKINKQNVKDYFITKNHKNTKTTRASSSGAAAAAATTTTTTTTTTSSLSNSSLNNVEYTELKEWPEPLTYQNSLISNIFASLVALLLLGLNGYLVVSLFMQI